MSRGGRRKHAQGSSGDGSQQLVTRHAVVTATGRDALTAAETFADRPTEDTVRELLVAYSTWRLACRKLIGALRHAERSGVEGLPSSAGVRRDERATLAAIGDTAVVPLDALAAHKDVEPRAAAAARELAGELTGQRRSGTALRVGTLRRGNDGWSIEPHAPGLDTVGVPHPEKAGLDAGTEVLYEVAKDGRPGGLEPVGTRARRPRREPQQQEEDR